MTKGKWAVALLMVSLAALMMVFFASGCQKKIEPPPAECQSDMDCPGGKKCEGGKCVVKIAAPAPECSMDSDCADNKVCRDGKCKFECTGNAGCPDGFVCEYNRCVSGACDLQTINFDFNEYYLTSQAQSTLRANAECLRKKAQAIVTIEGHCDERGTAEYNLSLGQKRAQAVRDFMVDLGLDPSKLKVISYGEERPVDPSHSEDAWAKNRRAETVQ
jgi:peptidoglycan-associated lipoprotein